MEEAYVEQIWGVKVWFIHKGSGRRNEFVYSKMERSIESIEEAIFFDAMGGRHGPEEQRKLNEDQIAVYTPFLIFLHLLSYIGHVEAGILSQFFCYVDHIGYSGGYYSKDFIQFYQ